MPKNIHEVRDPIHVFVRLDSDERKVLDSRPLQRLRHIHQLAMSYLVYPGATHERFEHSLGVMELAGRVFDTVTKPEKVTEKIRNLLAPISVPDQLAYWRRVLRMAALCHDIGHLPFSHSTERLLPDGWNHERLTRELISSEEMKAIWRSTTPPLRTEDVVKLAVGPKKAHERNPEDVHVNPESGDAIFGPLCDKFGEEYFRRDRYYPKGDAPDFPVLLRDGRLASSLSISAVLKTLPILSADFIFADRSIYYEADTWLKDNREQIIRPLEEEGVE